MSSTTHAAVRTSVGVRVVAGLGRQQHEQGPEALAAGRHEVRGSAGDVGRPRLAVRRQQHLDARQPLRQTMLEVGVDDREGQAGGRSGGHLMNSPATAARSRSGPGMTPRTSVVAAATRDGRGGQDRRVDDGGSVADRLVEVHDLDDPDVEERGDDAGDHRCDDDRPGTGGQGHGEHGELAHEARRQRDAGHGEQEEGEDCRPRPGTPCPGPPSARSRWPRPRSRAPGPPRRRHRGW